MGKNILNSLPFKHNWSEKQFFIHACFADDLQQFYVDWIKQSSGRAQFFDTGINGKLTHKYWRPSSICCESGDELFKETIDVKIGYWTPNLWKPVNKALKQEAMRYEALECQNIDCSCNDCKYLCRDKKWCDKLCKKIIIRSNTCHPENQGCFKHRRS